MTLYGTFEKEINRVKRLVKAEVDGFPPRLRELALEYLRSRHLMPNDPPVTGISLYLPFWLGTAFNIKNKMDTCRRLSAASLYITLSVELQDSMQDEPKSNPFHMWISDAFFIRAFRIFQSLFPSESKFWNYLERHMHDLYQYVLWERDTPFLDIHPLSNSSLSLIGKQTSFLKPTSTALAILGGMEERVEDLSSMLEEYHVGLKLVDDFVDWETDLKNMCYTSFLCLVLKWLGEESLQAVAIDDVRLFILSTNLVLQLLNRALEYTKSAKTKIGDLYCPYLMEFLDNTCSSYVSIRDEIKNKQSVFREKQDLLIDLFTGRNSNEN
jgi:hypothetical protein